MLQEGVIGHIEENEAEDQSPEKAVAELAKAKLGMIASGEAALKERFKLMRSDMRFAINENGEQWSPDGKSKGDKDAYVANFTQRHIRQKTSALYAKNPQFRIKRKPRLDFRIWDGRAESLQQAMQAIALYKQATAMGQVVPAPAEAAALMQDVQAGKTRRMMLDRVARTGEALFRYFLAETKPKIKSQFKRMVRRALTTGVGYVHLDFQRLTGYTPATESRLDDTRTQMNQIQARIKELCECGGDTSGEEAKEKELELMMLNLQSQTVVLEEGPIWDFPSATSVIIDPDTTSLVGWIGTKWIAIKTLLSKTQVQSSFGVDIGDKWTRHEKKNEDREDNSDSKPIKWGENKPAADNPEFACVYRLYDRESGLVYGLVDGWDGFLFEPRSPVDVDQFFPVWAFVPNELESEDCPFPPSDVTLIRHQQREHNRSREALRQHRRASAPGYATPKGQWSEQDKMNLAARAPHTVIELDGLPPGTKMQEAIAPLPLHPIDPNFYETQGIFQDTTIVVGAQEAIFGGTSGATATESSIAASATASTQAADTDDLDELLSELGQATFEVMMREMSLSTVKKIVGPGAVWPEMPETREEIIGDIYLEVVAGSSGKPNKAQEIANIERIGPIAMQIPGIQPGYLGRKVVELLDDAVDLEEAVLDGVPSIQAINASFKQTLDAASGGMGGGMDAHNASADVPQPGADPSQQGAAGAANAPSPMVRPSGPQPAFPVGQPGV
jgi:hypothetical protein